MLPYVILLLIPALIALASARLSPLGKRTPIGNLELFFWILIVFLLGFRHEVGGDWSTYLRQVEDVRGVDFAEAIWLIDPAYALLNWIGANIGGSVYFVNLVCASLFCWGLFVFCNSQPRPWLALVVAVPYLVVVVATGYSRQAVAIGFVMRAFSNIQQGNGIRFVTWVTLAALFHKSAVVMFPFVAFSAPRFRALAFIGIAIAGTLLFVVLLQEQADYLSFGYIELEYQSSGAAIRVSMTALAAGLFLSLKRRFGFDLKSDMFWGWMSWSALLLVPLLIASPSSTAIDRIALYWIPLQIMVFSRLPDSIGVTTRNIQILTALVVIYSSAVLFIWLFFADTSYEWIPYKFYPWEVLWVDS